VQIATAEDTILAKLEWAQISGGSARQLEDVRNLLTALGEHIDHSYLMRWANALGVDELLLFVRDEGSPRNGPEEPS
jgi:hypothetical protein